MQGFDDNVFMQYDAGDDYIHLQTKYLGEREAKTRAYEQRQLVEIWFDANKITPDQGQHFVWEYEEVSPSLYTVGIKFKHMAVAARFAEDFKVKW